MISCIDAEPHVLGGCSGTVDIIVIPTTLYLHASMYYYEVGDSAELNGTQLASASTAGYMLLTYLTT